MRGHFFNVGHVSLRVQGTGEPVLVMSQKLDVRELAEYQVNRIVYLCSDITGT